MWLLFLLISIFLSSAIAIVQKVVLKDKNVDSTAYAIFYQIITGVLLFVYAVIIGISFDGFDKYALNLFFMVLLYGLGDVLIFKAFQRSDLSDFTIVYQVNAFFNVVFSAILLHEYLNVYQWMGFLLLFAGIILSLYEHKVVIHKNHLLIVFCAAILSLAFINDAHVVKNVHVPTYLSIAFLTPGVITLFFYPRAIKNLPTLFNKKHFYFVPLASLLAAFGSVFFFLSYKIIENAAKVSSLAKISTVIIVLLGIFFFNEKKRFFQKILGSVLALVGVLFLV